MLCLSNNILLCFSQTPACLFSCRRSPGTDEYVLSAVSGAVWTAAVMYELYRADSLCYFAYIFKTRVVKYC